MKIRKIFLTLAVLALLSVVFATAISASEYDFISSGDNSEDLTLPSLRADTFEFDPAGDGSSLTFKYLCDDKNECIYIRPVDFGRIVEFICSGVETYAEFQSGCASVFEYIQESNPTKYFVALWMDGYYGCDEAYFNELLNYKEITQADLDELQTTIDSKSNEITELENANLKLEENLAYSRNQVTTLSQSRGELLAVNASLEKQLQNKINLAYAQGLVDSGSTSDVVPILIGVITLLEGVALVILIISKIKKRKKGR